MKQIRTFSALATLGIGVHVSVRISNEGDVMKEIKVWPHLTVIAIVCALAAGIGVGLWMKYNNKTAAAQSIPPAARIERVEGDVAISSALSTNENDTQWAVASTNTPFSVGDRIYTRENSHASIAFTGRNYARVYPNSSVDVLSLDPYRTQLALRDGSALFDVGYLDPGQVFEVGTPYGAVDFYEPGLYDVGINNNGNVIVSVLSGLAQVVGLGGSGRIGKGEMLTLLGATAADVVLSQINGGYAGSVVDDYYGYQYPQYYDGRYRDYNVYLNDPYYFDPYRRNASYQYASPYIPGLYDLDYYGSWQNVSGYGHCWSPSVASGWAPYQNGYWMNDYPYGLTWVSNEPWGYAPYHYGRWAYVGNQWYWVPDGVNTTPLYSPALVGFLPFQQNQFGWVPLAPGDPYVPRYYDQGWNPYYLTSADLYQSRLVNLAVPGAVAVLPIDEFSRFGDYRVRRWDRGLEGTQAVLDPLLLTPLRNAVVHSAWGRGKIDLPPGIAKKLRETQVVVSDVPSAPPFRRDLPERLRVTTVPAQAKDKPFKVKDERPGKETARVVPEQQRVEPVQNDKQARQAAKELQRQQRRQQIDQRQFRPEGVRVGNPGRGRAPLMERPQMRVEQPKAERPQMRVERPQVRAEKPQFRNERQQMRVERPQTRVVQPEVRRVERQGGGRPDKHQLRQAPAPQPVRSAPAVERRGPPAQAQQQQQVQQQRQQVRQEPPAVEYKHGPPANAQGADNKAGSGGKGKGKKP